MSNIKVNSFVTKLIKHPAFELVSLDDETIAKLIAHPLYLLASKINIIYLKTIFPYRAPIQTHIDQYNALSISIVSKQRQTLVTRSQLRMLLIRRLLYYKGKCDVKYPFTYATCILSRGHFQGLFKNQEDTLFEEGQRLYDEQNYRDAAKKWGQATLLLHGPSHAWLSYMLIEGRPKLPKDEKRAFELASIGASMNCVHSKGVLGHCYLRGYGVIEDNIKGFELGQESAASGSCFGQFVVGLCYDVGSIGFTKFGIFIMDYVEAARMYRLAAVQGHADAQYNLADMLRFGHGVAQDDVEAIRFYRLAAAQGKMQSP
jgi:TPR repeat protein